MDVGAFPAAADRMGLTLRALTAADRDPVAAMLSSCLAFTEEEIRVALDVFDDALAGGLEAGYALLGADVDGQLAGYACGGSTPLTESTWHLYWICVRPAAQGAGAGRALLSAFEALVRSRGGERVVVETSGREDYARARRFYEREGYREVGRIPDFYRTGDDCVLYCKGLR